MDAPSTDHDQRIAELEAHVARLTATLAPEPDHHHPVPHSSTRRGVLRLAGAAVVGATAAAVGASAGRAAASANGYDQPITAGTANKSGKLGPPPWSVTSLDSPFVADCDSTSYDAQLSWASQRSVVGVLAGHDISAPNLVSFTVRSGVLGVGETGAFGVVGLNAAGPAGGVLGRSLAPGDAGSPAIVADSHNGPALLMVPNRSAAPSKGFWSVGAVVPGVGGQLWYCVQGGSPGTWVDLTTADPAYDSVEITPAGDGAPTSDTWNAGTLVSDGAGRLWYCTAGGTPGTWVNLVPSGQTAPAAPALHPVTPRRLHDSRVQAGPLAAGASRTIAVRDALVVGGTTVDAHDYVPAGATALMANITVVDTVGAGFLAVNPKGDATVHAATVNWFASGQILNNGVMLTLGGDRELTVIAGGSGGSGTNFVVDVTGYLI